MLVLLTPGTVGYGRDIPITISQMVPSDPRLSSPTYTGAAEPCGPNHSPVKLVGSYCISFDSLKEAKAPQMSTHTVGLGLTYSGMHQAVGSGVTIAR